MVIMELRLPFEPIELQRELIERLTAFVRERPYQGVFLLNGHAGSGKTSIVGALIRAMAEEGMPTVVMAPTGRAAKVAASMAMGQASTIHKRIYRPISSSPDSRYFLAPNPDSNTLFIVDEASLITDGYPSNSLLQGLLRHVFGNNGNLLLLVGDTAQLPPVGMSISPAMDPTHLKILGYAPETFTLDMPMRQHANSGILYNATLLRQAISMPWPDGIQPIFAQGFEDVEVVSGQDLPDKLAESWQSVGIDETLIVTRSNWRANQCNMAIRNTVMYAEEPLQQGDRVVISKNDYYWSKVNKLKTFIANGDMAEVVWVGRTEKFYGRFFTEVELLLPSTGDRVGAKIMLRSLNSEGPSIPTPEMNRFYQTVMKFQEGSDSEKIKATMEDPYYNALQVKYGYCVTCHKAQGGQWKHVYVDMSGIGGEAMDALFFRWAYTAVTRATEKIFFINPGMPVR